MLDGTGIDRFLSEIPHAHIEENTMSPDEMPGFDDDDYFTNAHGERFDPAIHLGDGQGNPLLTKRGRFRKKAGRPRGTGNAQRSINAPNSSGDDYQEKPSEGVSLAAQTAAAMYINTGVMLFGAEWLPNAAQMEQQQLERAFHAYLDAHGIDDIPPSLALFIACFGYAAPRLQKPVTQGRLQKAIFWVKIKLGNLRLRYGTRPGIRSDRMRQNDAGEAHGEKKPGFWRARFGA